MFRWSNVLEVPPWGTEQLSITDGARQNPGFAPFGVANTLGSPLWYQYGGGTPVSQADDTDLLALAEGIRGGGFGEYEGAAPPRQRISVMSAIHASTSYGPPLEILLSGESEETASARDDESAVSAGSEGADDSSSDETSSSASSAPSSMPPLISDQDYNQGQHYYQRRLAAIAVAAFGWEAMERRRVAAAALGGA